MEWKDLYPQINQLSVENMADYIGEEGSFSVFMVIGYKYESEMEILRKKLSPEIRVQYDNAQDYMKIGRWMMFQISSDTDLRDYKLLMSIKMKPKKWGDAQ